MEKVKVYVTVSGDYCAFCEISFRVVYDVTNNLQLGKYTLDELEHWLEREDAYVDANLFDAIKDGDKYYVLHGR